MKKKINKNAVQKICQIGHSFYLTIPSNIMKVYSLKKGDWLDITFNEKIDVRDKMNILEAKKE